MAYLEVCNNEGLTMVALRIKDDLIEPQSGTSVQSIGLFLFPNVRVQYGVLCYSIRLY
jgi:hypothetical protein